MSRTIQTTSQPVRTKHWLHLVLTILTCGLWLPVWIVVTMINAGRSEKIQTVIEQADPEPGDYYQSVTRLP